MKPKPKTHYPQVPLELVKKIIESEVQQEQTLDELRKTKNKGFGKHLLELTTANT